MLDTSVRKALGFHPDEEDMDIVSFEPPTSWCRHGRTLAYVRLRESHSDARLF